MEKGLGIGSSEGEMGRMDGEGVIDGYGKVVVIDESVIDGG